MSDIASTITIIAVVVVLFVWDRFPVVLVALGTTLALWATGVLDLRQALAGLGNPAVIFIASLFVVSGGLAVRERTGAAVGAVPACLHVTTFDRGPDVTKGRS